MPKEMFIASEEILFQSIVITILTNFVGFGEDGGSVNS